MLPRRALICAFLLSGLAFAANTDAVKQAAARVEQQTAKAPQAVRPEFRVLAAEALNPRHPDLARPFVDSVFEQLRAAKDPAVSSSVIVGLASVAPSDAASILPRLAPGSVPTVIGALARANHGDAAAKLFQDYLATIKFDALDPSEAWRLINTANAVQSAAPRAAADVYERILQAVSAPEYGQKSDTTITATFQIGSATVSTSGARDTLLVAAGCYLHALAPDRFARFQPVLTKWDLSAPATLRGLNFRSASALPRPAPSPEAAAIQKNLGQIRGLATDAERGKLVKELAAGIRALPPGNQKLNLASSLCNLATEGDLGKQALNAVSSALAQSLKETPGSAGNYIELAKLVRYEHVAPPPSDPATDAAAAILELRDEILQETGFSLSGLDGKTYNLDALRGRVVLLNFWATWCPPCRKEMPDMEKLYQRFEPKGLIVLAVSDEERDTVTSFLKKQSYTFPVLLDPDRKVNTAFSVEGIPKSFLFDRQGKLVAQAIDMRTEAQFLEMFKSAGLE